jgi:hypothetical protein
MPLRIHPREYALQMLYTASESESESERASERVKGADGRDEGPEARFKDLDAVFEAPAPTFKDKSKAGAMSEVDP